MKVDTLESKVKELTTLVDSHAEAEKIKSE